MSYNRFNQLKPNQEYKPIGLNWPMQELLYFGEKAKAEVDAQANELATLSAALGKVKYAPWDADHMKDFSSEWSTRLQEVTNQIVNKDPNARNSLVKLKADWSTDQRIPIFEYNYTQDEAWRKDRATLEKEQTYRGWNDMFPQQIQSRQGLTQVPFGGIEGYTHPYEDAAKIMGNIASSMTSSSGERYYYDADGKLSGYPGKIVKYGTDGSVKELSMEEITQIARVSVPAFLQTTKGGQSFGKEITYTELAPNLKSDGQNNYIDLGDTWANPENYLTERTVEYLTSVAAKQAFRDVKSGYTVDIPAHLNEEEEANQPLEPGVLGATLSSVGMDKYKTAAGSSANVSGFKDPQGGPRPAGLGERGMFTSPVPESNSPLSSEESENYNLAANTLQKRGNTPAEQRAIWNEYVDWYSNQLQYASIGQRVSKKEVDEMTDKRFGSRLDAMNYTYIPVTDPTAVPMSGEQFINMVGKGKASISKVLGVDNPFGVNGPANIVTFQDENNQIVGQFIEVPRNVSYVDQKLAQFYGVKNPTYKTKVSLEVDGKDQDFTIKAAPVVDEDGKVVPGQVAGVQLIDGKGKVLLTSPSIPELFFTLYPQAK